MKSHILVASWEMQDATVFQFHPNLGQREDRKLLLTLEHDMRLFQSLLIKKYPSPYKKVEFISVFHTCIILKGSHVVKLCDVEM